MGRLSFLLVASALAGISWRRTRQALPVATGWFSRTIHKREKELDTPKKTPPPEAQRAIKEAEERRRTAPASALPKEMGGRDGPEPTRFHDWEKKGIASDF